MDVRIEQFARAHDGLIATWALLRLGVPRQVATRAMRHGQLMHRGVVLLGLMPPTERQRQRAATLTAPHTFLSHASAAAARRLRVHHGRFEVVVRRGNGGPRRFGDLLVLRTSTLDGEVGEVDGLPATTAERTILDLAGHLPPAEHARLVREALRTRATSADALRQTIARHAGRRGTAQLRSWLELNAAVPYERCRSDAEARALEVLASAGVPAPAVNVVRAGFEADLSWPDRRLILEVDGPQWHRDKARDAGRTLAWRRAGWRVVRVTSDDVYAAPARVVAAARD